MGGNRSNCNETYLRNFDRDVVTLGVHANARSLLCGTDALKFKRA